jgi:starch phosphorylase
MIGPERDDQPSYGRLPTEIEGFESLAELALNLRWSWNHSVDQVWRQIDPIQWKLTQNAWVSTLLNLILRRFRGRILRSSR